MSTNSLIAMKTSDGKVKAVYCHWDGYLGYVGRILINYYDNLDKVKTLINLGSISSLGVNPYIDLDGGLTNEEGFRLAVSKQTKQFSGKAAPAEKALFFWQKTSFSAPA